MREGLTEQRLGTVPMAVESKWETSPVAGEVTELGVLGFTAILMLAYQAVWDVSLYWMTLYPSLSDDEQAYRSCSPVPGQH